MKYRNKLMDVEALEFKKSDIDLDNMPKNIYYRLDALKNPVFFVMGTDGLIEIKNGDLIVTDGTGMSKIVSKKEFEETYEQI